MKLISLYSTALSLGFRAAVMQLIQRNISERGTLSLYKWLLCSTVVMNPVNVIQFCVFVNFKLSACQLFSIFYLFIVWKSVGTKRLIISCDSCTIISYHIYIF